MQIRKAFEEFQRMTPEEQAALQDQQRRAQIENAANQARDVVNWLEETAEKFKDCESAGSEWLEVAALCDALSALIKEESIPPVPAYLSLPACQVVRNSGGCVVSVLTAVRAGRGHTAQMAVRCGQA